MDECEEPLNPKKISLEVIKNELKDKLYEVPQKKRKRIMASLDIILSAFLVAPLVISCWRGIWGIMDLYYRFFPAYETFFFAIIIHLGWALMKDILHESFQYRKKKIVRTIHWRILQRIYTYIFTILCNMHWRATWLIMDEWTEVICLPDGRADSQESNHVLPAVWVLGCIVILSGMKSVRNVMGCPFFIFLDNDESFLFPTRFRVQMVQRTSLYILDCLFSVLIVGSLVVFVWRGAWVLIDIYLFPQNEVWSAWASLIFGYIAVAIAFMLQPAMRWLCDRIDGALRLFAADIFLLFSLLGTLNVWRGIWNLLNIYFIPDDLELSCWITHWVSLILLILLGCSNSLLVRGVYIDAEEPAGKCVVFPCYYLRLIFQQERERKLEKNVQLEVMAKRKQEIDNKIESNNVVITMDSNHI